MRYFITFSYDGTNYHGWQIQPNGISVQEVLQKALSTLLRCAVEVVGAGRTDAGVHASMMVAHFDITAEMMEANPRNGFHLLPSQDRDSTDFVYKLNKVLPPDIAVQNVVAVGDDMHARFSATSRTYHYFIHTRKDPFRRAYSWRVPYPLDFCKMNESCKILFEYIDFTSFSKVNTDTKTNNCTITQAYWEEIEPGVWRFTITANRFLRNMVRAIVGTLVEVGRGKLTEDGLRKVIEEKNRCCAGESVPGNALFLVDIKY